MQNDFEGLLRKYFWFLVTDFGFSYQDQIFSSDQLEIRFSWERELPGMELPRLYFRHAGEADSPVLPFDWILYYLENHKPGFRLNGQSLEQNMQFFADLLQKYAGRLLSNADEWWLPALKFRNRIWEEKYHVARVPTFKEIYAYIKAKEGK